MRLLVCGGRDYDDSIDLYERLDALHAARPVSLLIHGGAGDPDLERGADYLAGRWAHSRGVPYLVYPVSDAMWRSQGLVAGPIRNQRMIDEGRPDAVYAFPGGRGTADMLRRARAAGLPILSG